MHPSAFFAASRLVIVAGKGGVGKTTVTAALAVAAATEGLDVLVVEVEEASGLGALLGSGPAEPRERVVLAPAVGRPGRVRLRVITPDAALTEYLDDHGFHRLASRLASTGALDVVATAAPGLRDLLVLGKVKQLERRGTADLVLLDAPAAGHAVTFLQSARGLLDAVQGGPVRAQASDVLELLTDPARCSVMLVTLPEETPVNELVETAYALEDRVGIKLGPVVVNGVLQPRELANLPRVPDGVRAEEVGTLREAARFRAARVAVQQAQVARLAAELPLPQLVLPFLFTSALGLDEVTVLAARLLEGIAR